MRRVAMLLGLSALASSIGVGHHADGQAASKSERPDRLGEVLWWLPPDTQTLMVARGPWRIEIPEPSRDDLGGGDGTSLAENLRTLISGFPAERRAGASRIPPVAFALEGSRHFRAPKDLGMMPYEGARILVFQQHLGPTAEIIKRSIVDRSGHPFFGDDPVRKTETIAGHEVVWFEREVNSDILKTFIALPRPDVLVCATDRCYLAELLGRMAKKGATRALPADLPEWKHLDVDKSIWAIRHYDPKDAADDPSSPLTGEERAANTPDDRAVGLVFTFDTGQRGAARVRYLSGNRDALALVDGAWRAEAEGVKPEVRQAAPGVVELSLPLKEAAGRDSPSGLYFELLLLQALGHAVYL
jgi:hypothetical protein